MLLKEVKLYTAHLQKLFYFYRDILGMNCSLNENELQIRTRDSLLKFEKSASDDDPYYHFAFNIPSNKIEEAYIWLKERVKLLWIEDYKSFIADFSGWHAKSLYFIDAGGNVAEFISRFDLSDIAEAPFSASLIRNVSEIGLVFPAASYNEKINRLLSAWHLSYFIKQPPLEEFRAVGDDEGLFICVPEQRSWYPLKDKPAFIFPMELQVKTLSKEFLLQC
jgi:catechol 2,3-dioxygenase-like lactoylglutathione lyase family enzyme